MPFLRQHGKSRPAFLLLALMFFQGIGWFLAWQTLQSQAKATAHRNLFRPEVSHLDVVLEQEFFHQSKVGKREIRLGGNLYDIRRFEIRDDSVHLELVHDSLEQVLYSMLGVKSADTNTAPPQPLALWVAQWLSMAYLLPGEPPLMVDQTPVDTPAFCWDFPVSYGLSAPPFHPPRPMVEIG